MADWCYELGINKKSVWSWRGAVAWCPLDGAVGCNVPGRVTRTGFSTLGSGLKLDSQTPNRSASSPVTNSTNICTHTHPEIVRGTERHPQTEREG